MPKIRRLPDDVRAGSVSGSCAQVVRRPPLLLAAALVASGWTALYSCVIWLLEFVTAPMHDDVRLYYVAAEAGLRYGWSTIYDQGALRSVSSSLPAAARLIDEKTYASTPLLAWVFAPMTVFPETVAYVLWVLLSVSALVIAWHISAPYDALAKITLLLLAIGAGPVLLTMYFGQPTLIVLALSATAWWLLVKNRDVEAGVALSLAMFLKPQAVILLPVALLVSRRYRPVVAWAAASAALALLTVLTLGSTGLTEWWHVVRGVQHLPLDTIFTLAGPLSDRPLTYILWLIQGAMALWIAWARRRELEIVFAAGILGTVATASYFHNSDYCVLVHAGWLVLRTSPPLWHRLWLLVGVLTMQLLLTPLLAAPQLLWDGAWLAILAIRTLPVLHVPAMPFQLLAPLRDADKAARVRL